MGETKIHDNNFCHISLVNILICYFSATFENNWYSKYYKTMPSLDNKEREFYPGTFISRPRELTVVGSGDF